MAGAARYWGANMVELQRGVFSGRFDLGEDEVDSSGPDDLVVAVVVARVVKATPGITRKGECEQVTTYRVEEMRIPDHELRDALIHGLGLLAVDTNQLALDVGPAAPAHAFEDDFDDENWQPPEDEPAPVTEPVVTEPVVPAAPAVNGDEETREPLPVHTGSERVGSVYGNGRRDGDLARFLEG